MGGLLGRVRRVHGERGRLADTKRWEGANEEAETPRGTQLSENAVCAPILSRIVTTLLCVWEIGTW